MVSLAFGINAAWIDLMLDKYHSLYRFDSIDTFVDAVQGESGISIRSYDHFSCIVATSNIEWMVEKLVSVNGNLRRMVLRSRVPVIREDMWDQEDFGLTDNCIIAVPEQLLDAYRKHPIWSNYSNIVPIR